MVVDELQAKRPGSRQCAEWLVRSILYKHARLSDHRQVAPWRLAEVSPAVTYVSNHYAEPCPIDHQPDCVSRADLYAVMQKIQSCDYQFGYHIRDMLMGRTDIFLCIRNAYGSQHCPM